MACNDVANFEIPAHYASRLERLPRYDVATDEEILISLSEHKPIISEKNIWAFWDAGVASMPDWCKRNVASWVRINAGDGWTVRVLDSDAVSSNFALKFIPTEMLPDTYVERTMTGPWVGQHSADFIRCAIVYLYGGIYLDVGHMLFRRLDRVCWKQLEDPDSPYQVSLSWTETSSVQNCFIACRKGDPFIKHW